MAKHDQRILKFLAQNSDRAPTITDMMTRLNISISEISASLSSLLAQGLITKRTNNQGIECWFPAGNGAAPAAPSVPESRPAPDPRFIGGFAEKPPIPEPGPIAASPNYAAPSHHHTAAVEAPMVHSSSPSAPPQMMVAPAKGGIGYFGLMVAVAIGVAISTFLCNRLVERSVTHLSQGFVDQKVLNDAINSMNGAQRGQQSQVRALEDQVKKLTDELTGMKAADSLKTAKPEEKKIAPPPPAAEAAAPPRKLRRHHGG